MKGTRVDAISPHLLKPGEYTKWHGDWYAHCPGSDDLVANLGSHHVVEEADGSITVTPSILCSDGKAGHSWHGFLERGVWREA